MTESQAHPEPAAEERGGSATSAETPRDEFSSSVGVDVEPEWPAEVPEDSEPLTLVGCTVATRAQLPAARVLRTSFLRHHHGARFVLLLVDRPEDADRSEVLVPEDIGVDPVEFARLAMACTAEQLREVLRPRLLASVVSSGAAALYLEPSVQIFGGFDAVLGELTAQRPVALVPRVLRPLFADGLRPSAADLAEAGAFDPSAFAVRPGAEEFLAAWDEQVRADPAPTGTFLEGVPALVDHYVVRDPGVGLSVWNAAQRELVVTDDGAHTVDGFALRSVHFAGFQPQRPWLLSVTYSDRPRILLSEQPVLARLCANYRNALIEAGYTREEPHPFDTLPDGSALPAPLRAEYLRAWSRSGDAAPPSPFEPATESEGDPCAAFVDWACAPADEKQQAAGGSRWTAAVWADDPALQRNYPDPFGADAAAFHEWCSGVGVASQRLPAAAVHRRGGQHGEAMVDQLGVAVLGNGRLAELIRAAVGASGLPSADTPYYPVVLRCSLDVSVPSGRHVIDIRPDARELGDTDAAEVWVLSESGRPAARSRGGPAVRVLALPVPETDPVDLPTRKAARARYGLSDEFVVAAFVDHAEERQDNVLGLVSAFFAAFPDRTDVRLLIGVSGAAEHPEAAERLRLATAADPRVVLAEDSPEPETLVPAADCAASLHRAEGGERNALRLLDAASRGVAVITAAHGTAVELIGSSGARLVPCQSSGEPDVDAAARALVEAADDVEELARFAASAREHVLAEHSVTRAGERLRERVEGAYRDWRVKWAKDRRGQLDDPLHPLLAARHALHRAPDVGGGHAMAPALRKAVLKGLSHYDEHLRDILRTLVDGVEQTAAELLRRQYEADGGGDLDSLRGELTQLRQRQEQLDAQLAGTDDGMIRARADLADQHRRLRDLEAGSSDQDTGQQFEALVNRVDGLAGLLEKTLDRVDALERGHSRVQQSEASSRVASRDAAFALQRTDVLQRILLREHERNSGTEDTTVAPVLCDAGLLRLPADDSLMLPWLSSHDSWDPEVSALIDSLLEPDGIFLDVGAYVGYHSVRVLSRLGNSGAVVAVEPCTRSRELLRRNVGVNVPSAWSDRLVVIDGAAWDAGGELVAEPSPAGGVAVRPAGQNEPGESLVRAVRLDKELENSPALEELSLSVVHVDVGGRVHRALGGLVRLLRRDRPFIVCSFTPEAIIELGDDPAAALREFGTWGYELVPVGRNHAVSAAELLEAIEVASTSTVKLWLRPKGRAG